MSVISVVTKYGGLSGSGQLAGVREYTKLYTVRTNSDQDGVMLVGNAPGLPKKGDVYFFNGETDAGALCQSVTPRQDPGNQQVWEVTCEYSSDIGGGQGVALGGNPQYDVENPLQRPPIVTWSTWSELRPVVLDIQGRPVNNTADLPFDPGIMVRVQSPAVVVERNEATYPVLFAQSYNDAINSDQFYTWPPETAKVESITAQNQFANGILYWAVRYEIHFKQPDWKERVANQGTRHYKLDANGFFIRDANQEKQLFHPVDGDGNYSTDPVWLNLDGTRMPQDDIANNAIFLPFDIYKPLPFSALNL